MTLSLVLPEAHDELDNLVASKIFNALDRCKDDSANGNAVHLCQRFEYIVRMYMNLEPHTTRATECSAAITDFLQSEDYYAHFLIDIYESLRDHYTMHYPSLMGLK